MRTATFTRRQSLLRRELTTANQIPYTAHVASHVVKTAWGDYVQAFRLGGISFESADDEQLNNWHERLAIAWRNLAGPEIALWTHLIRRREPSYPQGSFESPFAAQLNERYRRRVTGERLMVNELYLSVVYRPASGVVSQWTHKVLTRARRSTVDLDERAALEACEKLRHGLQASLERYEIEPLGLYVASDRHPPMVCSRLLEFLGLLLNGESQRVPLPRAPLSEVLATSRPVFGVESIEYRMPTVTQLGGMLGIKEYPSPTVIGMFHELLSAPFPLVLTQSFTFLSKASGQGLLQRQYARLVNAGDLAVSQANQLKEALDALAGDEFVMGDHHFSLLVLTDPFPRYDRDEVITQQKILNDRLSIARRMLSETNLTVAREDLALEAAYWSQLPGYFSRRLRKAPITSRNFAAMAPFHNYPVGRAHGNHWGEATCLLITQAHSPFFFSLHATDPREPEGGSRRDVGHTFICGPTGGGKTVLIGFLICMLSQFKCSQIIIDKDRGLEILVRALGGEYLPLKNGVPTGCNPLQLPATPANLDFLRTWLRLLAQPAGEETRISVGEDADLELAIRGVMALDPAERRLSRLIEYLDPTAVDGLYARLSKWCHLTAGEYAWAFDNADDLIVPRIATHTVLGFDCTDLINQGALSHAPVRTPLVAYLLHLIGQLLGTRRLVCWMDEFQALLGDPAFTRFADGSLPTWRKLDGVLCMATQSPRKVLESTVSRSVVEQTPTKIYLPNEEATREDYREGFGLTEREYRLIKEQLEPGSRRFLVKQGRHSVVCQLDLKGLASEISVISARSNTLELMRQFIEQHGADPAAWLPLFYDAVGVSS
jgi:type IV secretion system protein VirB4